jgi:AraC family transcriptional regulator of arabinose operon
MCEPICNLVLYTIIIWDGDNAMYILCAIDSNNPLNSERVTNDLITVNSCGHFIIIGPTKGQSRIKGRADYQLIYVSKGCGFFNINGINKEIGAGNIIIYKPFEPQIYKYSPNNSEFFWIHFTGTMIKELLMKCDLWNNQIYYIGKFDTIREITNKIITEIQLKKYKYESLCGAYLHELIIAIARHIELLKNGNNYEKHNNISNTIKAMHNNYSNNINIDEYAKQCYISKYHYIRLFKEQTGMSPYAYVINIRMEKAKEYLKLTNLSISEIAEIVGYNNPFNFSNIFKKYTGQSPSSYRKDAKDEI